MQSTEVDRESRFKLAQIWQMSSSSRLSRQSYSLKRIINNILKDDLNVNVKFTIDDEFTTDLVSHLESGNMNLKDYTPLHFLYHKCQDVDTFTSFIARGADFTLKNGDGLTAFHLVIRKFRSDMSKQDFQFMNAVLSAHVKFQNSTNPRNVNGVSHFHGVCMANHIEAAELFLANGTSIEEAVNLNAPHFAGWSPLHFAAAFRSFEVAKILVGRGANVNAQTAKGENPIDQLMGDCYNSSTTEGKNADKEQFLKLLLDKGACSGVGLSTLHIACTLKDLTVAERFLDEGADIEFAVPKTSAVHPGNTALHFASENSIEAVQMLLKRGANINVANAQETSPLEICITKFSLPNLCSILSCIESLKEIRLSDGQTKLLDMISAMENVDKFKQFLQDEMKDVTAIVPNDSVLWPGYSILHLAVTLSKQLECTIENLNLQYDKTIVEECLKRRLSVDVANLEDQTLIHLAFSQCKPNLYELMFEHTLRLDTVVNLVDTYNLSYLHIACYMNNERLVDRLLRVSDPDDYFQSTTRLIAGALDAGSTPLHAAAVNGSRATAELLLKSGVDLHATDSNGMTPIHLLMGKIASVDREVADVLLGSLLNNVTDRVVDGVGLGYLHVACAFGNARLMEKLLELGSEVNAVIKCDERKERGSSACIRAYSNCTPLQIATKRMNADEEVLDVLLRHGVEIFTTRGNSPADNGLVLRRFFEVSWERRDMQRSVERRFGLTKLHVACFLKNEQAIESALRDEINVNARVRSDFVIFAGCTPLHLLVSPIIRNNSSDVSSMMKMLIDQGADVTIANAGKATPIHVFSDNQMFFLFPDVCMDLLLNAHRDFSVNPVNAKGISHFHMACKRHNVEVIEKFLQHGSVDVNRPISCFARSDGGCTPLHLALNYAGVRFAYGRTKLSKTVDLLLKHGADVAAKDVYGDTPLHKAAVLPSLGIIILEKLVSYGGDTKVENILGHTPIERMANILMEYDNNQSENLKIFQNYGYKINSWNRLTGEGYIPKIFLLQDESNLSENCEFKKFLESSDARTVDNMGRTSIHNAVAHCGIIYAITDTILENYTYAIKSLMEIGIDIEHSDTSGQTALHYAARMGNSTGVKALLACGADINIVDNSGKSAFFYAVEYSKNEANDGLLLEVDSTVHLRVHVQKLQHLKIEVSQLNQNLAKEDKNFPFDVSYLEIIGDNSYKLSQEFFIQVEMTKTLDIGIKSLALYNFLADTGAVNLYPLLPESQRVLVDHFFESIDYNEMKELAGIVNLQYKKMRTRLKLIDSALSSLRTLLGFSVPGLCEHILRFLVNSDLKYLIESTASENRKRKISEI